MSRGYGVICMLFGNNCVTMAVMENLNQDFGGKSLSQELIGKPGSFISVVLSLYWCVSFILYSREYMFIDLTF